MPLPLLSQEGWDVKKWRAGVVVQTRKTLDNHPVSAFDTATPPVQGLASRGDGTL